MLYNIQYIHNILYTLPTLRTILRIPYTSLSKAVFYNLLLIILALDVVNFHFLSHQIHVHFYSVHCQKS